MNGIISGPNSRRGSLKGPNDAFLDTLGKNTMQL